MNWYDVCFVGFTNEVHHVTVCKYEGYDEKKDDGMITVGSHTRNRYVLVLANDTEEAVCKAVDIINKLNYKPRKPKKKKTNWRS